MNKQQMDRAASVAREIVSLEGRGLSALAAQARRTLDEIAWTRHPETGVGSLPVWVEEILEGRQSGSRLSEPPIHSASQLRGMARASAAVDPQHAEYPPEL